MLYNCGNANDNCHEKGLVWVVRCPKIHAADAAELLVCLRLTHGCCSRRPYRAAFPEQHGTTSACLSQFLARRATPRRGVMGTLAMTFPSAVECIQRGKWRNSCTLPSPWVIMAGNRCLLPLTSHSAWSFDQASSGQAVADGNAEVQPERGCGVAVMPR